MDRLWSGEAKYQALLAVAQAANSRRDLTSVLEAVADGLEALVPIDLMGVITHERETARARAIYFRSAPRGSGESPDVYVRRFSEATGGTGDRWKHTPFLRDAMERDRTTLVLNHISTDPRLDGAAMKQVGAECAVLLPLTMGDEFVAALVIARTRPSPFAPEEVAILEDVARPVIAAVANALAFEEIQRLQSLVEEENVILREEIAATAAAAGGIIGSSSQLHEVLAFLAAVVESSSDAIVGKYLDGTIASWNRGAERIYGYPRVEVMGRPMAFFIPKERQDEEVRILAKVGRGERVEEFETERLSKDGKRVHVSISVSPVKDVGGGVIGAVHIARDVTARKFLETERERLLLRIRRLADAKITGIITSNTSTGAVVEANQAFLDMLGYDRADLAAGLLAGVTPPEWRAADARAVAELQARGSAEPYEKQYVGKDGGRVPVLVGIASIEIGGEAVALVLDLRSQKHAEEELHKAQAALTHVTRVATVGEVAASFAHELNQPLAAIVNNASASLRLLDRKPPIVDELRDALGDIVRDAERASSVIEHVRELVRPSAVTHAPLRLAEVVDDVVGLVAREALARRIAVLADIPADLPLVLGDRVQLQQVLLNLIVNAMDAITAVDLADREIQIGGRSETDGERLTVTISVRDRGIGLQDGQEDQLFDAFYTTKPDGMGLGLAISRSIIEHHGGRLWAEQNRPHGAVFSFRLPAAAPSHS